MKAATSFTNFLGQEIREDGPPSHKTKRGTPSMGGVAIIAGIGMTLLLKERTRSLIAQLESEHDWETLRQAH